MAVPQTTAAILDQFYTKPEIALCCVDLLKAICKFNEYDIILEPSAGNGAFFDLLPECNRIGIDIDPKHSEIIKMDYFNYLPDMTKSYLVVGNVPFGKNSNLAIKFFERSARFADVIAFILPRTFRKKSVINRLDKYFHLAYEYILPKDSFIFETKSYNVPCVFQIWQKQNFTRPIIPIITSHTDFTFVSKIDATFAIQRIGERAGKIRSKEEMNRFSKESHFFIKARDENVLSVMKLINFNAVKFDTAGNPSVSRSELIELYIKAEISLRESAPELTRRLEDSI